MSLHEVQTGSGRLSGKVALVTGLINSHIEFAPTDVFQALRRGSVEPSHAVSLPKVPKSLLLI